MKKKTNKLNKLEKNRTSILTNDLEHCYICGMKKNHLHEVYFGKNRQNSMKWGCVVPLCFNCHTRIHNDIILDTELKIKMQDKFEEVYDIGFISIFHRNYKKD